jgi:hypothetical protein
VVFRGGAPKNHTSYRLSRYIRREKMDELVDLVVKKTGISEKQAQMAVETVIKFLKDKLPDPIAGQLDTILEGGSVDSLLGGLGNLLGG